MVVGIDEVGRGSWAGPLVFGAVVLGGVTIPGLTDSKKLTKKQRETLDIAIRAHASAYALGWVSADELDHIGMSSACELACRRALEQIRIAYSAIIIDGTVNFLQHTGKGAYVTTMKQADMLVPSVSAASILAKVARDAYMVQQDAVYKGYGFAHHVGYGTARHRDALERLGVTPLHRRSFAPIATYCQSVSQDSVKNKLEAEMTRLSSRSIGDRSEQIVAESLEKKGYRILERNWKTKRCEIDIVAEKDGVLYCVEVKHRRTNHHGDGQEAITHKKLQQMSFAADVYRHVHGRDGGDVRLMVVATSGDPPTMESEVLLG